MTDDLDQEDLYTFLTAEFRSLTEISDLELGLSSYHTFKQSYEICGAGSASLFVDERKEFLKAFYDITKDVKKHGNGIIISDTRKSEYFDPAKPSTYKSVIVAPLFTDDQYIGHVELASRKHSMGAVEYAKISELLPLFANTLTKRMNLLENTIQSIIKEHYTSIHPAVEWKFYRSSA